VKHFERAYIEQLLVTFDGNVTHAAQEAKMNRRACFELIRKHRIELDRFRSAAHFGYRDQSDRSIVITPIGGS